MWFILRVLPFLSIEFGEVMHGLFNKLWLTKTVRTNKLVVYDALIGPYLKDV